MLQLDKLGGGIQYVDQRSGDKLYVLHATLPNNGQDLQSVNKQWFADVILSPNGDIVRSGVVAEGGRISRSQMIVDCGTTTITSSPAAKVEDGAPALSLSLSDATTCMTRRRLTLKYDTVTGSGVQSVERRGLVEAYQVGNDIHDANYVKCCKV